jgi:hypothetical protein
LSLKEPADEHDWINARSDRHEQLQPDIEVTVEDGPLGIDISSYSLPGEVDGFAIRFNGFSEGVDGIEKDAAGLDAGMVVSHVDGSSARGIDVSTVVGWIKKRPITIGFKKDRWAGDPIGTEGVSSGTGGRKLSAVSQEEKDSRTTAISSFFDYYSDEFAGMEKDALLTFARDAQLIPTDHDAETTTSKVGTSNIANYTVGQEVTNLGPERLNGHIVSIEAATADWVNEKFRGQNIKTLKILQSKAKISRSGQNLTKAHIISDEDLKELETEIEERELRLLAEGEGPVTEGPGQLMVESTTGRISVDKEKAAKAEKKIVLIFEQVKVGKKSRLTEERFAEALRKIAVELSIPLTVLVRKIDKILKKRRAKPTDDELERVAVAVTDEMDELREHLAMMARQSMDGAGIHGDLSMADKAFFAKERGRKQWEEELAAAEAGFAIKSSGMEDLSPEDERFFEQKRLQLKMDQAMRKQGEMSEMNKEKDVSKLLKENWDKFEDKKDEAGSSRASGVKGKGGRKSVKKVRKSFAPGGPPTQL